MKKLRILVVEDDPDLRSYVVRCLSSGGREASITEAVDGDQARQHILARSVDVVVTDVILGKLDGLSLCRILDETRGLEGVLALVVTGDTRSLAEARHYARGRPNRAVLAKPFNTTSLQGALLDLLEKAGP